jgi:hypothetical protein
MSGPANFARQRPNEWGQEIRGKEMGRLQIAAPLKNSRRPLGHESLPLSGGRMNPGANIVPANFARQEKFRVAPILRMVNGRKNRRRHDASTAGRSLLLAFCQAREMNLETWKHLRVIRARSIRQHVARVPDVTIHRTIWSINLAYLPGLSSKLPDPLSILEKSSTR